MNITAEEIELLKASKSKADWNAACDKIKEARKGAYPHDWWPRVVQSGLMSTITATF